MIKRALIFLSVFVLCGAAVFSAEAKPKTKPESRCKVYKFDLDADSKPEIIRVDTAAGAGKGAKAMITRRDKSSMGNFNIPGKFDKLEIVDLNEDGYKQIAVYSSGENNYTNLVIYSLKNNRLSKVFAAGSEYGIDTDFRSVLARVKVGKAKKFENGHSYTDIPEWDVWVWSGEEFVRD